MPYGVMELKKMELKKLGHSYDRTWAKVFNNSFDQKTLLFCQFYLGLLPLNYQIDQRKLILAHSIRHRIDPILTHPYFLNDSLIGDKCGVLLSDSPALMKCKVFFRFEKSLRFVDAI